MAGAGETAWIVEIWLEQKVSAHGGGIQERHELVQEWDDKERWRVWRGKRQKWKKYIREQS